MTHRARDDHAAKAPIPAQHVAEERSTGRVEELQFVKADVSVVDLSRRTIGCDTGGSSPSRLQSAFTRVKLRTDEGNRVPWVRVRWLGHRHVRVRALLPSPRGKHRAPPLHTREHAVQLRLRHRRLPSSALHLGKHPLVQPQREGVIMMPRLVGRGQRVEEQGEEERLAAPGWAGEEDALGSARLVGVERRTFGVVSAAISSSPLRTLTSACSSAVSPRPTDAACCARRACVRHHDWASFCGGAEPSLARSSRGGA